MNKKRLLLSLVFGLAASGLGSVFAEAPSLSVNPFTPYLDGKKPEIVKEIQPWTLDEKMNVAVRKVVIRARTIAGSPDGDSCVLVILAKPAWAGNFPGVLQLHGGSGSPDECAAKLWAKAGYVVTAPELPGIADPAKTTVSTGPIRRMPYHHSMFVVEPEVTSSTLFDGIVAGIKAFYLLKAQPEVLPDKLGITGVSWGGFTTTMLCGLLGDEVKAATSIWGAGFYDYGSSFQKSLDKMPITAREHWLRQLDAGRYSAHIACPIFYVAAANDSFFYPPCLMQTYQTITSPKAIVWAPNNSHVANIPGGSTSPRRRFCTGLESDFLDFHLKGVGKPLPGVSIASVEPRPEGLEIKGAISHADDVETVTLYYSVPAEGSDKGGWVNVWTSRKWEPLPCKRDKTGDYSVVLPAAAFEREVAFFVSAREKDRTVSSPMWNYPSGWPKWTGGVVAPAKLPAQILALGDSITAGHKTFATYRIPLARKLQEAGFRFQFIGSQKTETPQGGLLHEGYPGKSAEEVAGIFARLPATMAADIVLIHAGHNHFAEQHPVAGIVEAHRAMIDTARCHNSRCTVLVAQVIPSGLLPKYSYIPELNRALAELVKELNTPEQPVLLVDMATGFDPTTDTVTDRVHPNEQGAEKMAAHWFTALKPLLESASASSNTEFSENNKPH